MNVEKAVIGDIDALVKIRLEYLREDFGHLDDHDAETIRKDLPDYYKRHLNKDLFVYVIREDGIIAACAFLLFIEKPMSPAFLNGRTGTVLNVYTYPAYRRRGYAGRIMETMISEAKENKITVIELKSTEDGYALYRSAGFFEDQSKYRFMKWKDR